MINPYGFNFQQALNTAINRGAVAPPNRHAGSLNRNVEAQYAATAVYVSVVAVAILAVMVDIGSIMPTGNPSTSLKGSKLRIADTEYDPEGVIEVFKLEAAFTNAKCDKPIVATEACIEGVALGGYDATNHLAFVVQVDTVDQFNKCGDLILDRVTKLSKAIASPIQLHLRSSFSRDSANAISQSVIEAIKNWVKNSKDIPMEIVTEEKFRCTSSLAIDARNGKIFGYDSYTNPNRRQYGADEMEWTLHNVRGNIRVVYEPE